MATYVNGSTQHANSGGSITKPPGLAQNDVQFCFMGWDFNTGTPGITGGAAWTQIGATQRINHLGQSFAAFYQVAGASEPASYTISSTGSVQSVCLAAYRGLNTSTPFGTVAFNNPDSASPPASPVSVVGNSVTTGATNQTVVLGWTVDWQSQNACSNTPPSGFTTRLSNTPTDFDNCYLADGVFASAGATGSVTGTCTNAGQQGNFVSLMIPLIDGAVNPALGAQTATFSQGTFSASNNSPAVPVVSAPLPPLMGNKVLGPLGLGGFALRQNVQVQAPPNTVSLGAQTATFTQGTFSASSTGAAALGSQTGTFSQGTFTASSTGSAALGSQTATFSQGTLTAASSGSASLGAQTATFSQGSFSIPGAGSGGSNTQRWFHFRFPRWLH